MVRPRASGQTHHMTCVSRDISIPIQGGADHLSGLFCLPPRAFGLVIFAHGSGADRLHPGDAGVARGLNDSGLATLQFELLTESEARERANLHDIPLLAQRLGDALVWAKGQGDCKDLDIGFFGSNTGVAAATVAAADHPDAIHALVSLGGQPELAGGRLAALKAPTLLIVGGADFDVLDLNQLAQSQMICINELAVLPGVGHPVDDSAALELVIRRAADWFVGHFS